MIKFSILTVTYNCADFISDFLKSVKDVDNNTEVIIVDNNSTDRTVDIIAKAKAINLCKSSKNLGFGAAMNLAAEKTQGEFLFIINPDTKFNPKILEEMSGFLNNHADAGVVAPVLVQPDGQIQESVTKLPTIQAAISEFLLKKKHAFSQYAPDFSQPTSVEACYGACWMLKKQLFIELGGFDQRFFMYFEDLDFCRRLSFRDKKVYILPQVSVEHLVGGVRSNSKSRFLIESAKIYHGSFKKWLIDIIIRIGSKI